MVVAVLFIAADPGSCERACRPSAPGQLSQLPGSNVVNFAVTLITSSAGSLLVVPTACERPALWLGISGTYATGLILEHMAPDRWPYVRSGLSGRVRPST